LKDKAEKASALGGGLLRVPACCYFGCGGLCVGFAGVGGGDLAAEALDAAGGVDQLLLAGKERVAGSADFDDDIALVRGAGLKQIAAGALDADRMSYFG
jgi:hypothetical protein